MGCPADAHAAPAISEGRQCEDRGSADADFAGVAIDLEAEAAARVGLLGSAAKLAVAAAGYTSRGKAGAGRVKARRGDGELHLGKGGAGGNPFADGGAASQRGRRFPSTVKAGRRRSETTSQSQTPKLG